MGVLAWVALSTLVAFSQADPCRSALSKLAESQTTLVWKVEEEILEQDSEGSLIDYRWKIPELYGTHRGYLDFQVDLDNPTQIQIISLYGSEERNGVGQFLLKKLRESYPDVIFQSDLQMLNGQRFLQAIRDNAADPDWSKVPAIAARNENFSLELNLIRGGDGVVRLINAELTSYPGSPSEQKWIAREKLLAHPLYQEWVQQGARSSLIETWERP